MPPKSSSAKSTKVYIVSSASGVEAVYASRQGAVNHVASAKDEDIKLSVETKTLIGGSITITGDDTKTADTSNPKPTKTSKGVKAKEEEKEKAEPELPVKKTLSPAEQRAANAAKSKPGKVADANLPPNVKSLLEKGGNVFSGTNVVVTGVMPTLGRKITEKLVEAFGAHLTKSLSSSTGYVVIGNDAGPSK